MTIKKRALGPDGSNLERRKSQRFQVPISIEASWRGPFGKAVKEAATVRQANAQGALLKMRTYPEIGSRVTLTNFFSAKTAEARVLATPYAREGVSQGIAVELIVPSESFWGVSLQVKKAFVELAKLEKCLQAESIDLRLFGEYRDAVNWIRMAAQIVRELRERQLDGRDEGNVVSSLANARIQRVTNLILELLADLDASRVDGETKGMGELQRLLDQASTRLKILTNRNLPKSLARGD